MKSHQLPKRTLLAHLRRGMLVAADQAMAGFGDAVSNPARIDAGQEWYGSAALAGCGKM